MDTNRTETPVFSFIIVNYRSAEHLPACFSSFQNVTIPTPYECLVANNDLREQEIIEALHRRFSFTSIHLPRNGGFGYAVNRAAERARGEILVVLNPDARFLSGNLGMIAEYFRKNPSLGCIGMNLLLEPETPQPWSFGRQITLSRLIRNHLVSVKKNALGTTKPFVVSWVSGAAFALPRSLFFQLHGFDERFFLYYEDIDLCSRLAAFNKKSVVLPALRVLHIGGGSMQKTEQKKSYYDSQDRYFSLHRPRYEGALLKFLRGIMKI